MATIDDTKARLLAAAGPIFADKGYQAATVRDICHQAGVRNLASVNYYFGDKERLYIETVKLAQQMRTDRIPMPEWPAEADPRVKLHGFVHTLLLRVVSEDEAAWRPRLMLREILQPTAACRELVEQYFRPNYELLLSILDELLPDDVPPHKRHLLAFSVVGECVYYRVAKDIVDILVDEQERQDHFSIEALADHITETLMAAIGRTAGHVPALARSNRE
jgi:AcrR family transcriptional regulator